MKEKKWIKLRHIIISAIAYPIVWAMTVLKYHVKFERFKEAKKRKFLILYNHQTAYDQFFIGLTFVRPVYYLATEDIFSMGFLSKLLRFAVAPIPIKKQTSDLNAVKLCIKVANEGGNIAIAPEGQRTYSGVTTYINPAIATLAKKINLPIAFFKIEGGYGVQPRWSDSVRKGKLTAKVSKIVEPEEFNALSKEELYDLICKELYVNE
ncbi:MAG: 1-acyl-sn-glycerol-3-phosphate acyltransferase, partial [Lachnospiraceae bacterium]|nr:1-acyl-sn-glycerol-3-phosphate acyltransferase [Lachnospiraceae bacterium]